MHGNYARRVWKKHHLPFRIMKNGDGLGCWITFWIIDGGVWFIGYLASSSRKVMQTVQDMNEWMEKTGILSLSQRIITPYVLPITTVVIPFLHIRTPPPRWIMRHVTPIFCGALRFFHNGSVWRGRWKLRSRFRGLCRETGSACFVWVSSALRDQTRLGSTSSTKQPPAPHKWERNLAGPNKESRGAKWTYSTDTPRGNLYILLIILVHYWL